MEYSRAVCFAHGREGAINHRCQGKHAGGEKERYQEKPGVGDSASGRCSEPHESRGAGVTQPGGRRRRAARIPQHRRWLQRVLVSLSTFRFVTAASRWRQSMSGGRLGWQEPSAFGSVLAQAPRACHRPPEMHSLSQLVA